MPVNATTDYFLAEKKFNDAKTTTEKIKALEEMLRTSPSHKSSENLRASIKQRLAKYRGLLEKEKTTKGSGFSVSIKKDCSAQVIIIGFPNSGKSYLLSKLTNAKPEIADYEFTTKRPEVGIMEYTGVKIQIIEIPALFEGFIYKDKGPSFFSVIRNADLVLFLIDEAKDTEEQLRILNSEFEKAYIRLNKKRPDITIKRHATGGLSFIGNSGNKIETLKKILMENSIFNATVEFHEKVSLEELQDCLNEKITYLPCIFVKNKKQGWTQKDLGEIKNKIWENLNLIRIFTKTPGKEKDWPPVAMKNDSTINNLALVIHKDFLRKFKYARVWGNSAKFPGQRIGLDHVLEDNDIIEIHTK